MKNIHMRRPLNKILSKLPNTAVAPSSCWAGRFTAAGMPSMRRLSVEDVADVEVPDVMQRQTSAGMPFTRSCSQEEMAMASVTGVPVNMPGVEKKLLGPRRTGEGVDMPCWFMGRRGDGIRRRGVPMTGFDDLKQLMLSLLSVCHTLPAGAHAVKSANTTLSLLPQKRLFISGSHNGHA